MRQVALGAGMVLLGVLLAYKFMGGSEERPASPENTADGALQERGKGPSPRQGRVPAEDREPTFWGAGEERGRPGQGIELTRSTPLYSRRNLPPPDPAVARQLMAELSQRKPHQGKLTSEDLDEISRLIQELRRQGRMAVPAIREFLNSGQDVSFANYAGKVPPAYSSLRTALIDVLGQIGGQEATEYMVSMLQATTNPEEMAFLSRGLELSAPAAYRSDILNTARVMLEQGMKTGSGQYPGLAHVFGVIQDYGDANFASDLETLYRNSPPSRAELALLALSKLPEGNGVPTLIKIVNEMSGNPAGYGLTYDVALRTLTQASREYPEAGQALLNLAATNRIGTTGLIQVANALGGTEHSIISKSSETSRLTSAEMKFSMRAAETWSNAEIDQRLELIDQLLRTKPQPAAVKALEDARNRLLVWAQRPMVGGKRVKQ